jgi:hypothetical protein
MKLIVGTQIGSYTFDAAAGEITLAGLPTIQLSQLQLITNMTDNVVIYQFNNPAKGGSISSNVITLTYNTAAMSDTDSLQIILDYPELGQKIMDESLSVTIASDQDPVAINLASNEVLDIPTNSPFTPALPVIPAPIKLFRGTFAAVRSGADPTFFSTISTGAGASVSQSAGNLVVTAGTTASSETILRSTSYFTNELVAKAQITLSQRIVNNNFFYELVDVIGDGLSYTINSAVSVTVTIPSNPFTSENVGQGMNIGAITGAAGIPGRFVIASVSGSTVTFTVAGWPASGSGTCSLFGWNYIQLQYQGTSANQMNFDAQRRGWNSGATLTAINNTSAPGHMPIISNADGVIGVLDQLVASSTFSQALNRASRVVNCPEENTRLYLQLRSTNASVAPASNTTWTVGMVSVENFVAQQVSLATAKPSNLQVPIPVSVYNSPAVTVTGTLTTVTTVSAVTSSTAAAPGIVVDVASAALTTTTTTAAATPASISYSVNIPVTVVSGTNPTLDIQVQESLDSGTNWIAVYDFPRITATGSYNSPPLKLTGNRTRYVQTVGGTTPSFTRAINRLQSTQPTGINRQLIDRTVSLTTLNSTTPTLQVGGGCNVRLVINLGAATTPPALQLEGSDDNGASWYAIGTPLTGVASSSVQTVVACQGPLFLRARVSTAGVTVTPGYVLIGVF